MPQGLDFRAIWLRSIEGIPIAVSGGDQHHLEKMRNEFTAIIERDGEWFISYCPEIPGANGQGLSKEECLESLRLAIELVLEDRREDALRGVPADAVRETVLVG